MGTMKTFDPAKKFTATELTAPDGRPFTATSLPEYNELVAKGYSVAKSETPAPQTDETTLVADTAPATADAQSLVDPPAEPATEVPADTAAPAAGKATGRSGGAK